jgi:hypothetical protein
MHSFPFARPSCIDVNPVLSDKDYIKPRTLRDPFPSGSLEWDTFFSQREGRLKGVTFTSPFLGYYALLKPT